MGCGLGWVGLGWVGFSSVFLGFSRVFLGFPGLGWLVGGGLLGCVVVLLGGVMPVRYVRFLGFRKWRK